MIYNQVIRHRLLLMSTCLVNVMMMSSAQMWNANTCSNLLSCVEQSEQYLREMTNYPNTMGAYTGLQAQVSSPQCSLLRNKMECMMNFSPYCLRQEVARNIGSQITKVKMQLDNQCDQVTGWSNTQCYRRPEITQNCESMLREINVGQYNYYSASIPRVVCERYLQFRTCAYNVVINSCTPLEREKFFSYLMDKTSEVSWKCGNDTSYFDNYERWHPLTGGSMYNSGMGMGIPPVGSIIPGSGYASGQLPPYAYNQGSYGSPLGSPIGSSLGGLGSYDRNRPYSAGGYGSYGSGLGYPQSEMGAYDEANCLEKTRYVSRHCEDNLIQRQRDARNSRSAMDIQRRICCSLFYYQDCLTTAVLKSCRDSSPTVVSILMGDNRRRELTQSCREYNYEMCSGSSTVLISSVLLLASLVISFKLKPI